MNRPTRIIIVDDHQLILDGLLSMLNSIPDIEVVGTGHNGIDAIRLVETLKVDVVLMDIDMPEMDGIEAAKMLISSYTDLKVIMLTMHDEKAIIRKLMELGVHGYLLKNSGQNEITLAIEKVKSGDKYFSQDVTLSLASPDIQKDESNLSELSSREREILILIAEGNSNKLIGEKLFISPRTVEKHRSHIMDKLNADKVTDLVRIAMRAGLVE